MDKFVPLLLEVWQEACRSIEIRESVNRIAPLLVRRLPLGLLLVRRIDVRNRCVETVAERICEEGIAQPIQTAQQNTPPQIDAILRWCIEGRILRDSAEHIREHCPGLLPRDLTGDVLAGPLRNEQEPVGALILVARSSRVFEAECEDMAKALLEPFSAALGNDHQLRELNRLREAVEADNRSLLSRLGRQDISDTIVGSETGLRSVMERVELVSQSNTPILILGETGTGKEVVARAIHNRSPRAKGPFLRVNCGAIPLELVDSELFGHERGSFTGAVGLRRGWFERADGGTLFLDEMAELPLAAQVRLLRVLQDGSFERVGGQQRMQVDVRVVAATHRDLRQMVADGRFREDLWYRIAVFPIYIPPLRDRVEDIPAMSSHFALRAAKRLGTVPLVPTPADNDLLVQYDWPGNVRELSAVMERAAILGNGQRLEIAKALGGDYRRPDLKRNQRHNPDAQQATSPNDENWGLEEKIIRHIEAALQKTGGKIEGPYGAATLLKINANTLRGRMRKHGIQAKQFRREEHSR